MVDLTESQIERLRLQHNQLIDELDALQKKLSTARKTFAAHNRQGAADALHAVIDHLETAGVKKELGEPLLALWGALADADIGIRNPLTNWEIHGQLTPEQEKQRKGYADALELATAAAVVTILTRAKWRRDDAEREVVSRAGGWFKALTLGNLRKEISRGNSPVPKLQKDHYNLIIRRAAGTGWSADRQAEYALTLIRKRV